MVAGTEHPPLAGTSTDTLHQVRGSLGSLGITGEETSNQIASMEATWSTLARAGFTPGMDAGHLDPFNLGKQNSPGQAVDNTGQVKG